MDDWAAALSLLKVSAERDVSPSRVDSDVRALPSGGPTQQGYGAFPQAPPGLAPPPPPLPPSMEKMLSLDDLEGLSMGQQARAPPPPPPPPPPVVSAAPGAPPGAAPGVARRPRGLVHGPASKGPASARQPPAAASPPEDLSVYTDRRSMPMLFGSTGAESDVMSNWLGGMLGGAAPRPTTHAQPKAGPHTAPPKAAPPKAAPPKAAPATSGSASGGGTGKVLVLLDMNGTLLLRLKGRLGKESPSFTHAGLNYYLRRGVRELVQVSGGRGVLIG